jgi:hypothetical protein
MRTRMITYLKSASAAVLMSWALLPTAADAQGIVLTGGTLSLDFADGTIGGNSTTIDRLDKLTWSGGSGALAGQNLVSNSGPGSCSGDPAEFWGQSYGEPEGTDPLIIFSGSSATASNVTTTSMTSTTTGMISCSCGNESQAGAPAITVYNVFPAGDPNVNEMRVSRTIQFSSTTPVFNTNGVRGYVARLPIGTYNTVLIPNAAGTAINTVQAGSCPGDCEITDWNGKWFADDNGSGSGMVVFRDSSSTSPAIVSVNYDGSSSSNLTSIILLQPTGGWKAPVTETEWLCFYDPTTWTAAQQAAGTLPTGCAQHPLSVATMSPIAFPAQENATIGSAVTSTTQQINGIAAGTPISIVGGTYSINGGAYTAAAQTVNPGDYVSVQVSASTNPCTTTVATLTIGGVSAQFAVTTPSAADISISLNVSPGAISQGSSATLTWGSNNATACTATGSWTGAKAVSGTSPVTPTTAGLQTYTLSCTNGTETANATVNLIVTTAAAPAPTVTIAVNPTSVNVGTAATLTWSSTNATACTASGSWTGTQAVSGTTTETPTAPGTQTFTLTCTGAGGSAHASATLTAAAAPPPAPTVTISVNPTSVIVGASATLTWSSTNATTCAASGAWAGSQATSGTAMETPTAAGAQTFTLTCTGAGGSANASATLTATSPAPTVTLSVDPNTITLGQSATLTWSSTNATACTASGAWTGSESTSGTTTETPAVAGSQNFTLTCTGAGGSANATTTLTANPLPVVGGTTASGKVGGGGAFDIATLAGLLMLSLLSWQMRGTNSVVRREVIAKLTKATQKLTIATIAMIVCGVLLASPGHADDFGFDWQHAYVGARAGQSIYKGSATSIENSIGDDADAITSLTINSHQFGGVLYAGVPIWKSLSLELGYAQLGQFPMSMTTQTSSPGNVDGVVSNSRSGALKTVSFTRATKAQGFFADTDTVAQEVVNAAPPAGHGITLGFAMPLEVLPRLSVEPRFAALFYQSKQSLTTSDATLRNDNKGVGFDAGVALSVRVIGPVYLGAAVDCFHQDRSCNVLLVSGQLEYRFGH